MTQAVSSPAISRRIEVRLCDLDLAPENLRAGEPADDDVPRLAETIRAAGLIYPLVVRAGRRGEAPYVVLDGRRRRFALLRLAEDGAIAADHLVDCLLAEGRAASAAAAVLPNAEHAPVHPADVIVAIGKLRRARLTTRGIAEALGYEEVEVRRLEALAGVHADVLTAFRAGKLTLTQVRQVARLRDRARQAEIAADALGGYFNAYALQALVSGGRLTLEDPRFAVVTLDAYAAAGGRVSEDLFGELPAEVLDAEVLDSCWRAAAEATAAPLRAAGLALSYVRERGFAAPEGLEPLPFVHWGGLPDAEAEAFDLARERLEAAIAAAATAEAADRGSRLGEVLSARLALAQLRAGRGEVVAAVVSPCRDGLDVSFYQRPAPEVPDDGEAADAEIDAAGDAGGTPDGETPVVAAGVSHAQHAAATTLATLGLARDLADAPAVAEAALTAHLFSELAVARRPRAEAVLQLTAVAGPGSADGVGAEVRLRLDLAADAWRASGQTPLAFVGALGEAARRALLANLTAALVDLREARTDALRPAMRHKAAEIAALCDADLGRHWTPDAAFVGLHSRTQLLAFLHEMSVELPKAGQLRKTELVQAVVEAAAARRWLPAVLRWPHTRGEAAPVEPGETDAALAQDLADAA